MMFEKKYFLQEIKKVAKELIETFPSHKVFAFEGEMGAGKTTLIKNICKYLGTAQNVSSPTFSLINEYNYTKNNIPHSIFHIDLYRLQLEQELFQTGIEECIYSEQYCFIEWPDLAKKILPKNSIKVSILTLTENERMITGIPA